MKLLFDQNLSRQLPRLLADLYPESLHVLQVRLDEVADTSIRDYARPRDFIIVTKDNDYRALNRSLGHPPNVVLITLGNCPTADVEQLLRESYSAIAALYQDEGRGLLELPG